MAQFSKKGIFYSLIFSLIFSLVFTSGGLCFVYFFFPEFLLDVQKTETIVQTSPVSIEYEEDDWIADLVEEKKKGVVSVVVSKQIEQLRSQRSPFDDFFFNFPFGSPFSQRNQPEEEDDDVEPEYQEVGGGTGFIIREDGLIATNKHVVDDSDAKYSIVMYDGEVLDVEVVAIDPFFDFALLHIVDSSEAFYKLELGDSDEVKVGHTVIAIGNALAEFSGSVTKGIVSGLDRTTFAQDGYGQSERLDNIIQVDVAINPGNSGGPLLNMKGEVIGINTAVANAENIGFSLPVNDMKQAIESYIAEGKIERPKLGVRYVMNNKEIQEDNDLPYDYGAIIVKGRSQNDLAVVPGGPADKAGLEENDIILEVDGEKVDEKTPLLLHIQKHKIGETLLLKVYHDGEEKEVELVLEEIEE